MVAFARMLSLDDKRWLEMNGGYKHPFDPRSVFAQLEAGEDDSAAWGTLWNELHHQGDVGDASYASVPILVHIYRKKVQIHWNTYAIVATIELARTENGNPELPEWVKDEYFGAIRELAEFGAAQVMRCEDGDTARAILSVIALAKGCRTHAQFLINYSETEMLAIESGEWSPAGRPLTSDH